MQINAALALLVSAVGTGLCIMPDRGVAIRSIAILLGFVPVAFGAWTQSLNFIFLGLAIVFYTWRRLAYSGQLAAIALMANALLALTGYVFGSWEFHELLALPTVASSTLLAVALIFSRPDLGIMTLLVSPTQSGRVARRVIMTLLVSPMVIGGLTRLVGATGWYDYDEQVSSFVVIVLALILRATWKASRIAEREELRSQAFASLVEYSSDFIGIADPEGRPTYLNPAGRRMVGLSSDFRVEDARIEDFYPESERAFAKDSILRGMFKNGVWKGETYFRNWKTGERIPVSDTHFLIRERVSGTPLGVGTITRDISSQKSEEHELRKREEQSRYLALVSQVLSESLDFDYIVDRCGRLAVPVIADASILRLLDPSNRTRTLIVSARDEAKRAGLEEIGRLGELTTIGTSRYKAMADMKKPTVVRRGSKERFDTRIIDPALHRKVVELGFHSYAATPILARGKAIGIISFLFDNPDRQISSGDPAFLQSVADRIALSLENARLYKAANDAIRGREEVLAFVSHDLKNPLTAITLSAQALRRTGGDKLLREKLLERMDQSAVQMKRLIADLLDFTKVEAGTFRIEPSPEHLAEVVLPLIDALRAQAEEKKQKLVVNLPPELPLIMCDRHGIGLVVSNLIGNSIKFTPEGGTITLSARDTDRFLEVSVSDTGPGIPPKELPQVFKRYWQSSRTRKLGSGLGLTISKGIVEAHGGTIRASSEAGAGATFTFTIPLARRSTRVA
jgi:PAS domain S-box-containing protein